MGRSRLHETCSKAPTFLSINVICRQPGLTRMSKTLWSGRPRPHSSAPQVAGPSLGPATSHSSCSRPIGSIHWFWERISSGKYDWVPPDRPAGNGQKPPGTPEAGKGGREDSLDVTVHHQSATGPCAPSGLDVPAEASGVCALFQGKLNGQG